ncbi:DinB family protein [Paenisporosarcina cavernae]|uniref:DUF664 domain-containing protein n=1 Tax=Paenisporosarcina cavernae TaxID=2320858 RepID=A0A385YX34_9BACL|nr:DinB family protein [Paenisporosarcina cavernae]AYC30072.1 DUF664 domain-containing protein [Paenisporosarcina cavernae]
MDGIKMWNYHKWATQKLLQHVKNTAPDTFTKEAKSSFPTMKATYAHVIGVEYLWFLRMKGEFSPTWKHFEFEDIEEIQELFTELHEEMEDYFYSLEKEDWHKVLTFQNVKGATFETELEDMLFTFINHASYHRGQITTFLRTFGYEGIPIDYIYFTRDQ